MSAEEQTAASTETAPAVEPSTNGEQANGAAESANPNGDAEAMEVDGASAPPAEKKEEKKEEEAKADESPAAEPEKAEAESESEPAKQQQQESSKPASGRQTRPKPESAAKPASTTEKKVARPRSSVGGGPAKAKSGGAAAAAAAADRSYSFGDIVLGRLKGYPPWRESARPMAPSGSPADVDLFPSDLRSVTQPHE